MEIHAGIDLSLRSTGISILRDDGKLLDFCLVSHTEKDEELLVKNAVSILLFLKKFDPDRITIEGLSFGAISGSKDILQGNFWFLRCNIWKSFIRVPVEIVAVSRWRKYVIPKERARILKVSGEKFWQKEECVRKLPKDVRERFDKYLKENKFPKKCLYDLTDSYWIANYSLLTDK